jgi:type IV pilus assembly protein PilA
MLRHDHKGFTLLELLVVTAIVGILASIAIPQYSAYRARGFDSKVASTVRNVATGEEAYYTQNQTYSGDVGALDGMILADVVITVTAGNSGDLGSSFKIAGTHNQAAHDYEWVSDPNPGEPNFIIKPK